MYLTEDILSREADKKNIKNYLFHGYLLKGGNEAATHQCRTEFRKIVEKPIEASLAELLTSITNNDLFQAVADVLNTRAYLFKTCDELFVTASIIVSIMSGYRFEQVEVGSRYLA